MYNKASKTFKKRTEGLHPDLILWLGYMLATCPIDIFISSGVRTLEEQQELYSQGRTKSGRIVTDADGIKYKSNHQTKDDGYGHAVDIYYVGWTNKDSNNDPRWDILHEHSIKCANLLGIKMQHGYSWKMLDKPHHELDY